MCRTRQREREKPKCVSLCGCDDTDTKKVDDIEPTIVCTQTHSHYTHRTYTNGCMFEISRVIARVLWLFLDVPSQKSNPRNCTPRTQPPKSMCTDSGSGALCVVTCECVRDVCCARWLHSTIKLRKHTRIPYSISIHTCSTHKQATAHTLAINACAHNVHRARVYIDNICVANVRSDVHTHTHSGTLDRI